MKGMVRNTLLLGLSIVAGVAVLFMASARIEAYPNYHDPALDGDGYCATCHNGFVSRGPTHDLHVGFSGFTMNCDLCHTGTQRNNPFTMWSVGDGSANSNNACSGCHGRDYGETIRADYDNGTALFAISGLAKMSGYGLRKRHLISGITQCLDCHADVPRCSIKPESVDPPYYPRTDVVISSACFSSTDVLDNDGDGRVNNLDPDCNPALATTPGEAGAPCSTTLLEVTAFNSVSGDITLGYGLPCSATDASLYYGPLTHADLASYNYMGQVCGVGAAPTTFNPGTGSAFFIVVGDDGTAQGSYGQARTGVDPNNTSRRFLAERPGDIADVCSVPQSLTARCD